MGFWGAIEIPFARLWATKAAVHIAKPEFPADEQHAIGGPPVEVDERPGDYLSFQDSERLCHRFVCRHAVPGLVVAYGGSCEGPHRK